jgi:hypothetical protein
MPRRPTAARFRRRDSTFGSTHSSLNAPRRNLCRSRALPA